MTQNIKTIQGYRFISTNFPIWECSNCDKLVNDLDQRTASICSKCWFNGARN